MATKRQYRATATPHLLYWAAELGTMRKLTFLLTLALLLAAIYAPGQESPRHCPPLYDVTVEGLRHYADADVARMTPATVTKHVDGDTFHVRMACPPPGPEAAERVRLMGIDTPELGEPGADQAARYVENRTGDVAVYLAFDFRRRDRFDRLLAFVYLADGTLLNAGLLECGLAEPYRGERNHFSDHFEGLAGGPRPAHCPEAERPAPPPGTPGTVVIETIVNDGRAEHLLLRNASREAVDVSGWRIGDDDGTRLTIPATTPLAPGATLALCSGRDGCVGNVQRSLTLTEDNIWGNSGDAAFLRDARGTQVSSHCYEKGC